MLKRILQRYRAIPIQVKASLWFTVCSILQKGISLITVPIFTRIMSTEQYGMYSTYVSWYNVLIVFTSLNLYYGVFNNAMVRFEEKRDRYISSMQGLTTTITLALFILYLPFRDQVNSLLGMSEPLVLLLFIELLVTPALQFWTVHNRFDFKYKNIVAVTLVKSILNPVLGIIFVLNSENKDLARVFSIVLVEVIVCGIIALYQFAKGKCFFDKAFWKYAITFNLPLLPHYLSGTILNQGDRLMINALVGASAVAFYSVAYNIGILMNIITNAITASFTPWIYQRLKAKKPNDISRITNMLLVGMLILVSLLMFLGPEIMSILASEEYAEAVYVIPPVAGSVFFIFMYNLFSNVEFFYEERKYVTIGSILAAIVNIILNAIFIPVFGYYAAGYTTLACYAIYGLSHLFFTRTVIRKHLEVDYIFDSRFTILLSAVLICIVLLQNVLYHFTLIRWGILVAICALVIMNRKKLLDAFKMLRTGE